MIEQGLGFKITKINELFRCIDKYRVKCIENFSGVITNETMRVVVLGLCLVLLGHARVEAKVYTKCGLTSELISLNFPRTFIGNWVCLIESESGKNTSRITNKANGKQGVGLFQIRSKDWCTFGKKGGTCNVKCEDMLDENIKDDSVCAEK